MHGTRVMHGTSDANEPIQGNERMVMRKPRHRKNPDHAIFRREGRENETTGRMNGAGWSVNLSRGGRPIQTSFHDATYGSKVTVR